MHTKQELLLQFEQLGLQDCHLVMVHASLRRLGPAEGGASGLLDVILECIGPKGTLVMPLGADDSAPFEAATSPVEKDLGTLAEIFRQRKDTRVNDHAAARFGAIGPQSTTLLEPIPLHHYYGPGSPLSRFAAMGGWVLRLGADIDTVTLTHWAEYEADFPDKRHARRRYVRADTGEQWIESLDDVDGVVDWPEGDYFSRILIDFLASGAARTGPVGNCTAELFAAADFVPFAVGWMEERFGA